MTEASAKNDGADAHRAYQRLLAGQKSLMLATVNEDGTPLASYAPYIVTAQQHFYIFISQLARHTANLQRSGQASLMLIEDEAAATQIFARQRLTFQCTVHSVPRDSAEWGRALEQYEARFGNIVQTLRSLPDF